MSAEHRRQIAVRRLCISVPRDTQYSAGNILHVIAQGAKLHMIGKDVLTATQFRHVRPYSVLPGATIVSLTYQRHGDETGTNKELTFAREIDADTFLDCVDQAEAIYQKFIIDSKEESMYADKETLHC